MNIAEILRRSGRTYGTEPAICFNNNVYLTFNALHERVAAIAGYLRHQLQLKPGERVALVMENRPEYIEVMFAAWYAGLAVVPMNAKLHSSDFRYILENSGASLCFTSKKLFALLAEQQPALGSTLKHLISVDSEDYLRSQQSAPVSVVDRDMDDLAWLFYTSGTTGRPKGAMLSHRNLYAMLEVFLAQVKMVSCGDHLYHGAPMSHGSGFYILPYVAKGGTQLVPKSGGFDVSELLEMNQHYSHISLFAAPTMVKRLVEDPQSSSASLGNIDAVIYGGGPMYQAVLKQAYEMIGNRFIQIYGQGESPMTITVLDSYQHGASHHPRYAERLASVGVPHFRTELRIIDENGENLPAGAVGEILVKADTVMLGYWDNQAATDKTVRNGWLYTGDVGYLDEDGFLYLTDRRKDVIISGGTNIYPREVEEILLQHPGISEVSVIGWPDDEWGEVVLACVVLRDGYCVSADELEAYCLEHIARFKRPKIYRFFPELPKNSTGKILKTELRKQCVATDELDLDGMKGCPNRMP